MTTKILEWKKDTQVSRKTGEERSPDMAKIKWEDILGFKESEL